MATTEADKSPSDDVRGVSWLRRYRSEILAAILAVVCYINVLPNDYCDDGVLIVRDNPVVTEPGQWLAVWTTDYWSKSAESTPGYQRDLLYRPVSLTTYRIVRAVAGDAPLPQHIVNILLHALVSLLVVRLCIDIGGSETAALIAGAVFAVLPIHSEVIANIVGRADLLATGFFLLAWLSHRRLILASRSPSKLGWIAAASAASFCALGAKESAIALIAVIPLADLCLGKSQSAKGRTLIADLARSAMRCSYLILPAALYFALRFHALGGALFQPPTPSTTINFLAEAPMGMRILGALQLWGMYWAKTLWPTVLSVNYAVDALRLPSGLTDPSVIWGLFLAIATGIGSIVAWRRERRLIAFASLLVVVCYLPTANLFSLLHTSFAERIWYLPSVGVALLAGLTWPSTLGRRTSIAIWGLIILGMMARDWNRSVDWRNNGTLYAAAYRDLPESVVAMNRYGEWLVTSGEEVAQIQAGIELLARAVTRDPGYAEAHRTLGVAYLRLGEHGAALNSLLIANMQVPGDVRTLDALRTVSSTLAEADPELPAIRELALANQGAIEHQLALLDKLIGLGLRDEALALVQTHESQFADDAQGLRASAVALATFGLQDEAIDHYRRASKQTPGDAGLFKELAALLIERRKEGDLDEAWNLVTRAGELAPDDLYVYILQAKLMTLRGQRADADLLYEQVLRALPPENPMREFVERERARTLGK